MAFESLKLIALDPRLIDSRVFLRVSINVSNICEDIDRLSKKIIFENYLKKGSITNKEWKFCEKIDWHPIDELPLKEEFIRKISDIKGEKPIKVKKASDIFR